MKKYLLDIDDDLGEEFLYESDNPDADVSLIRVCDFENAVEAIEKNANSEFIVSSHDINKRDKLIELIENKGRKKTSIIHQSSKLYFRSCVKESLLRSGTIVGDFSRIENSNLGLCCKIERNNLIRNTYIGNFSYTGEFTRMFDVEVGRFVSMGWSITIGAHEHNYKRISTHSFVYEAFNKRFHLLDNAINDDEDIAERTIVGNDVWIGCHAIIKRGVKIGDGAIIGSGAIVTKDVPPYAIVVGCPARVIKYRFSKEVIDKLLQIKWWNWRPESINKFSDLFKNEEITIEEINDMIADRNMDPHVLIDVKQGGVEVKNFLNDQLANNGLTINEYIDKIVKKSTITYDLDDDGNLMAFVSGYTHDTPDNRSYITQVYTLNDYRGLGLCGKLLDEYKAHCRKLNLDAIWLTTEVDNFSAQRAYTKAGFRITGNMTSKSGTEMVVMECNL